MILNNISIYFNTSHKQLGKSFKFNGLLSNMKCTYAIPYVRN
jgi:hypothetical protein